MSKTETPKTDAPKTDAPKAEAAPKFELPKFELPNAAMYEQFVAQARDNMLRLQGTMNQYWDELAGYENAMYARARAASQDLASLASESIGYVAALTTEWRKMTLEATRRVTESFKA